MKEKADSQVDAQRALVSRRESLKLGAASMVASLLPLSALAGGVVPLAVELG
jgi:hypothetical protein